jgi:hypothetical protein
MSRSLTGKSELLFRANSLPRLLRGRPARLQLVKLFLGFVLICAAATSVLAQQAQSIKSEQILKCGGPEYQLRLVTAASTVRDKQGKALAIVLTPNDASGSKVFGIYWMNPQSPLPSHRDDTTGTLNEKLLSYSDGKTSSFFSGLHCPPSDVQVSGIQKVTATQNLLDTITRTPLTLQEVVQQLNSYGVDIKPEQIQEASAPTLELFKGLKDEVDFAKAIRQYVSSLLAAEGLGTDPAGQTKPTVDGEKKVLEVRNKNLEDEVKQLKAEKDSVFGGAPLWVSIGFVATSGLSFLLFAFIVVVLIYSYFARKETAEGKRANVFRLQPSSAKATAPQGAPSQLTEIITNARERQRVIEKDYSELGLVGAAQINEGDAAEKLADTIVDKLRLSSREHKEAKGIIKAAVQPTISSASKSRQRAEELSKAYNELQNQLETFQTPVQSQKTESAKPEVASALEKMTASINNLESKITEMKTSVDDFDNKVAQRFGHNLILQNTWRRLYDTNYPSMQIDKAQIDKFVDDLDRIIHLHSLLIDPSVPRTDHTVERVQHALNDLEFIRKTYLGNALDQDAQFYQIVDRVKVQMENDAGFVKELKEIRASLSTHFEKDVKAKDGVAQLIEEQSSASQKLKNYHSLGTFNEVIDAVVSDYETMAQKVNEVLPSQNGTIPERVTLLANGYLNFKPKAERAEQSEAESARLRQHLQFAQSEARSGKELVDEIAVQLNFKSHPDMQDQHTITDSLNRLRSERESSPYLQLRMGLSSALITLERATSRNGSAEQAALIEALFFEKIKRGLKAVLAEMEDCSGDELWTKELHEGFKQQWLHYLIRADLLLRTYYSTRKEFTLLRRAVSQACSVMLAALLDFQVEVVDVSLFEKLPTEMDTEAVFPGLRNLPAVREKVGLMVRSNQTEEVVVDVTSFPILVRGVQTIRGCVALANPSAWLQN